MNYHVLINKAEDYIENNLDKRICLEDIAKDIGISKYHFHRIFHSQSDETIAQFIARIKMERSGIYLVVNREISITEIAYRYGYCDASSYNKAFKKHFGTNPTEFRNRKNIQSNE
jgi:AraC family transcriptional regulator